MRINYKHLAIGGLALNFMLAMSPSQAVKQRMVCPSDGKRPMFNIICPGGEEPIPIEEYENKSRPPSDSGSKSRRNCSRMPNGKVGAECDSTVIVPKNPQQEELDRQKEDYLTAYDAGNYAKARKILSELVKYGDAWSHGAMYDNGYGVTQDYKEAVKWYRKAAEQDDVLGQVYLGSMYHNGYGVTQDYTEAVKWYRKAADQGYAIGKNNLGFMYEKGEGVTQDYSEAVKWYHKAAEQEEAWGQYNLGRMYEKGYGVTQDYSESVKWYHKAAEQGHKLANNDLKKLLNR